MTKIFADNAPAYWEAGLPVIPLRPNSKIPAPNQWQKYGHVVPDQATQTEWTMFHPDGNMGLPLGSASGMCALDLDTDDEKIRAVIESVIPLSPWIRRGKKGAVWMFKFTDHRTFRIRTAEGDPVVELLSKGAQVVLPPSIHPDTMQPYVANDDLLRVAKMLPPLPDDIEQRLRDALVSVGVTLSTRGATKVSEFVPSGGRDSQMTAHAGILARAVTRGERNLKEAVDEIRHWIENYTAKVVGDTLDPEKGAQKIMEFVKRDVTEGGKTLPPGWDEGLSREESEAARLEFGTDFEEWTVEQMQKHVQEAFDTHERGAPARARAIEEVMLRLSKTQKVSPIEEASLLNFIVAGSGRSVMVGDLRRRLKDLRGGDLQGNDQTEIARALIKELERTGEVRYEADTFYQWKGSHWEPLSMNFVLNIIASEFGTLPSARKHNDHRGVLKTAAVLVKYGLKDISVDGINFANGFLTLDGQLMAHEPKYGAVYVLPYCYRPELDGAALRFNALLHDVWGHTPDYTDRVQALREAIATTLFRIAPRYSRAICLIGIAHSGKSTLKDIVLGLVPEGSVCAVPPQKWDDRFMPAQMYGKLINFCGELSESEMIPGDLFKQIVEGDEINGQFKNRDIFRFKPMCAHWFASNHLPRSRDTSKGFTRRWLFLEFDKQVSADSKVINLAFEILAEEREAIMAWAIGAVKDMVRRQDYTLPASHHHLESEVASQNNSVRFFFQNGGVVKEQGQTINEKDLFQAYWTFCKMNANSQPVSMRKFRLVSKELERDFEFHCRLDFSQGYEIAYYDGLKLGVKP